MAICERSLCLACQSTETPLVIIPLADLDSARPSPLRESKTVRQWVSGLLGTSQPPQVACLATVPLSSTSGTAPSRSLLAVLYTSGLLSVWEAASGRHLCQTIVGSGADGRHVDTSAPPVTVTGMYDPFRSLRLPWTCMRIDCIEPVARGSAGMRLVGIHRGTCNLHLCLVCSSHVAVGCVHALSFCVRKQQLPPSNAVHQSLMDDTHAGKLHTVLQLLLLLYTYVVTVEHRLQTPTS